MSSFPVALSRNFRRTLLISSPFFFINRNFPRPNHSLFDNNFSIYSICEAGNGSKTLDKRNTIDMQKRNILATSSALGDQRVNNQEKIIIYQYKICPFCHRIRALLDFLKLDYEVVEVNPLTKSEISFSASHKKVPIAKFGDEVVVDSANIIQHVKNSLSESSMVFTDDSDKWIEWSEKKLAVMLYPNITRNFAESWQSFEYTNSVASWSLHAQYANRVLGPVAMYFANGKIKKKYGIKDERAELKAVCDEWVTELSGKPFLHGNAPTLPDLMVYGVLRAISGLQTFDHVMTDKVLSAWYQRMNEAVISFEKK